MKTSLITISIIACIILLAGCTEMTYTNDSADVSVIWDITDPMMVTPKVNEITSLFGFDDNIWNGGKFRFFNVSDVSINKIHEVSIESENEWLSNKFNRNNKIKRFYSEITEILAGALKQNIGRDNTSLYLPIAKELKRLSKSKAAKRVMLIYSDLMENTDEMSFYGGNDFLQLKTNPNAVTKYFDSQLKLDNLNGIQIYLVFQPLNMKQDEVYKVVSGFYKKLFEAKGATVEITASVN
jgi:hypothetical protein